MSKISGTNVKFQGSIPKDKVKYRPAEGLVADGVHFEGQEVEVFKIAHFYQIQELMVSVFQLYDRLITCIFRTLLWKNW